MLFTERNTFSCTRALCIKPSVDYAGGFVGELALAGGTVGAQLRDRDHQAERALRGATQSNSGGPGTRGMAGLARRRDSGPAPTQSPSRLLPVRGVTCWPVSMGVGNVKNNDPSLIEPIAAVGEGPPSAAQPGLVEKETEIS
jgi:hypothetical protein